MSDSKTHFVAGLLGCAMLLVSGNAGAQGPSKNRAANADLLFRQGQALLDAGHIEAACTKFEASEFAENRVGTLLHLGDCYERAGRTASAWHTLLEAEAVASAKKDKESEAVATARVSALEPKLTRVVFIVPMTSRVPGLTVRLGKNTIAPTSWGATIPVDAGLQQVNVSAKGYDPWTVTVDASDAEGRLYRINVPTLTPAARPVADRGKAYRTAGVVTGSMGLAGIGAGAVFSALSRNPDDASTCVKGVVQCAPNKSSSLVYSDAATVSFALGGALLATGLTLFVLSPSPDNKEKNSLRVAARYAGGGGRVQLEGVW